MRTKTRQGSFVAGVAFFAFIVLVLWVVDSYVGVPQNVIIAATISALITSAAIAV